MDNYKLKVRIGQHEFDAEGPQEAVERQFAVFKDLVSADQQSPKQTQPSAPKENPTMGNTPANGVMDKSTNGKGSIATGEIQADAQRLAKIFRSESNILSLTALPQGEGREADAALLLLFGYKVLRSSDVVGVVSLLPGLKQSGYSVKRFDRVIGGAVSNGLVIKSGQRIGAKFRLTNQGLSKAHGIAQELLALVV